CAEARSRAVAPGRSWRSMYKVMRLLPTRPSRLRVELDDQALLDRDRQRNLGALRFAGQRSLELVLVPVQVHGWVWCDLERLTDRDEVLRLVDDLDDLAGLHPGARDVDPLGVEGHVAVGDELSGLTRGEREPEPEHHAVEARLELTDHLLAGDAAAAGGAIVVAAHMR